MRATVVCAVLLGGLAAAAPMPKNDEKPPPVTEKHIKASQENLKQIGIAFHEFHDKTKVLPVDIVDKKGNPILSWRVAILPHLGQEELFKQFRFEEPWDSQYNKKLIAKIPAVYKPVRVKSEIGTTYYQTFKGKNALFEPGNLLLTLPDSIPDGTSVTGLVFEAGEPVVWTKPQDMPFDVKQSLPKLGGLFNGSFNVVCCDCTIVRIKKNADIVHLRRFIMSADGHVVDLDQLTEPCK